MHGAVALSGQVVLCLVLKLFRKDNPSDGQQGVTAEMRERLADKLKC